MNQETLKRILSTGYDRASWRSVLTDIFGVRELPQNPKRIPLPKNEIADSAVELGSLETIDSRLVGIYEVELTDKPRIWQNRVGLRQLLRNVYHDVDAAIVVFVQGDKWRLSLISEIRARDEDTGEVVEQKTEPKRFTYLLGKGETVRTPVDRLAGLGEGFISIVSLIDAFSVEPLNKAFFREYKDVFDHLLAEVRTTVANEECARLFAQRLLNRLMFLYFIQKKGWMQFDGDVNYLRSIFNKSAANGEDFYRDRLYYVFFYGLSNHAESKEIHDTTELETIRGKVPYLNGGLFEPEKDGLDEKGRVPIGNQRFTDVLELFERYNFTIDESTPFDVQIAVDPEMLGKVFEELVTGRHESGSYYTPRTVVSFMCREALKHSLKDIEREESITELIDNNNGKPVKNPEKILERLKSLKICDPACGSGAYLLGMLQELLHVREVIFASDKIDPEAQYRWKREIIENNIYGVDLDRFATQIAALRLWLSLAIESEEPHPLPNLKYKIGCGDSLLAPIETVGQADLHRRALIEQFRARKKEYTDADDHVTKSEAEHEIERLRIEIAQMFDHLPEPPSPTKLLLAKNSVEPLRTKVSEAIKRGDKVSAESNQKKLNALLAEISSLEAAQNIDHYDTGNTFDWSVEFAEVFEDGGFDIVLANPPYVQLQRMGAMADKYASAGYETFARTGDIYCLFYELGQKILKARGVVCYITSNKWMRAAYGEKTRKFFAEKTNPILLIDFAGQQIFEGATVDTNILMFSKEENGQKTLACTVAEPVLDNLSIFVRQSAPRSGFDSNRSWIILSEIERRIKSKIEVIGTPLRDWDISIYRGVLTGFNDAFIIDGKTRTRLIEADPKSAEIIRPILRGRDIKRYSYNFADRWLINTHNGVREKGILPVNIDDYPAIKGHLDRYWSNLEGRADRGATPYNLRNCAYIEDFSKQKIVWGNLNLTAAYCMAEPGTFINAPSTMIVPGDAYLLGILNSKLADYYIRTLGVTRNGGYFEYKPMFIEKLPVPEIDKPTRTIIADLVTSILGDRRAGIDSSEKESRLDELVFELYELTVTEKQYILSSF